MRRFVLGWKMFGLERSLGSRLITYADDLVTVFQRSRRRGHQAPFGRHIQAEAAFSVEEPYRRRGIGEKLFKRIQRAATNHGVGTIEIICLPDSVGMRMLAQKFKTHFTFEEGRLKARLPTPLSLIREASGDMLDLGAALFDAQWRAINGEQWDSA